eukprot:TRINITY_DN31980_c0_g1_i1.p1 TRINITY_DN31980_c0_g1~~TRINITY_DN31980_c0_g1_i1.p1  ORF type:complete len:656 (+),score=238.22 TRINITY_DN31980_c0_g1_i1:76-2043(+)
MVLKCFALLLAAVSASQISPTEKVIDMLEKLKEEVEQENAAEQSNFQEFSQFCTSTEAKKEEAVKLLKDQTAENEATFQQKTSDYAEASAEEAERKSKAESLALQLEAKKKECSQEKSAYESSDADLSAAVLGLESAISRLNTTKDLPTASLLQLGSKMKDSLNLAEAMGFLKDPKRKAAAAFLQGGHNSVPDDSWKRKEEYEFQSGDVVDMLSNLLADFEKERDAGRSEWTATQNSCTAFKSSRSDEISDNEQALLDATQAAASLKGEVSDAKQSLATSKSELKAEETYLAQLQAECSERKADFEQRSKARADEATALGKAIAVMKEKVLDVTSAEAEDVAAPAFLQKVMAHEHETVSVQSSESKSEKAQRGTLQWHAASLLAAAGTRLRSSRLSGLALRIQQVPATDPLSVVKDLVRELIGKLQQEAEEAATQKGFCDSALSKARHERDRRFREAMKINAKLGRQESKREQLRSELDLLLPGIAEVKADLLSASELRANESRANLATIQESRLASRAVDEAISELSKFYRKAARRARNYDMSLLQLSSAKKETPVVPAGFEGSYAGKQDAADGVLKLMEVVRDDFKNTAEMTKVAEEKAAEEFTKMQQDMKVEIASKETKKKLSEEDLATTLNEHGIAGRSLANPQGFATAVH